MLSPVVARALNVPAPGVLAPMLVPSMLPALISTVARVAVPDPVMFVNTPVDAEFAPIGVPSIAPPFTSMVENDDDPVEATLPVRLPVTSPVISP